MQIQTNQKQRELKDHGTFAFPVNVSHENLFSYERSSFFWHWHPEIELTLIVSGDINYQVNDKTYHLTTGEGLFCNANMPHTGHMYNKEDCVYIPTYHLWFRIQPHSDSLCHTADTGRPFFFHQIFPGCRMAGRNPCKPDKNLGNFFFQGSVLGFSDSNPALQDLADPVSEY